VRDTQPLRKNYLLLARFLPEIDVTANLTQIFFAGCKADWRKVVLRNGLLQSFPENDCWCGFVAFVSDLPFGLTILCGSLLLL